MSLINDRDVSLHKERLFLKGASTYMQQRWEYDHEYYQRMIDRNNRMKTTQDPHFPQGIPRDKEDGDNVAQHPDSDKNPKMLLLD